MRRLLVFCDPRQHARVNLLHHRQFIGTGAIEFSRRLATLATGPHGKLDAFLTQLGKLIVQLGARGMTARSEGLYPSLADIARMHGIVFMGHERRCCTYR